MKGKILTLLNQMYTAEDIYLHLKDYIKNNPSDKPYKIYILSCARPGWIVGWEKNYKFNANSHISALVHFYEKVKKKKILMENNNYLNLFDYVLTEIKNVDSFSLQELGYIITSFYFGYDGLYDCALYIMNLDQHECGKGIFLDRTAPDYCVKKHLHNHK
jgi:hypothetical protein